MSIEPKSAEPSFGGEIYDVCLDAVLRESRGKSKIIFFLLLVLAISIGGNIIQFQYTPPTKVVSETVDGRIRPIPTMDDPIFTDAQVMNWAAARFEDMYDIPFTKISQHPGKLRTFMLSKSADQLWKGFQDAGLIDKIMKGNYVMRGIRSNAPTITASGVQNDRFVWVIEMPMNLIFEGPRRDIEKVIVRAHVGRENLHRSADGLVIGSVEIYPGG